MVDRPQHSRTTQKAEQVPLLVLPMEHSIIISGSVLQAATDNAAASTTMYNCGRRELSDSSTRPPAPHHDTPEPSAPDSTDDVRFPAPAYLLTLYYLKIKIKHNPTMMPRLKRGLMLSRKHPPPPITTGRDCD